MNRYAITLGALTVAAGAALSLPVTAATTLNLNAVQATGACQGALPNYEGSFRKRPLAIANEGSTGAYLTCGARSSTFGINQTNLIVTNRTAADADINCTVVDGLIDATLGFADFYPQVISVPTGEFVEHEVPGPFSYVAWSCNVPAAFEVNTVVFQVAEEIGA
jgi:hypothetical protein